MKEENFIIVLIIAMIGILGGIGISILYQLKEMKTDHECYMMSDKEFYSSEQCKPYWEVRK